MPAYDGTSTDKFWIGFTPENSIDDDIGLTKEELSKIPFVGYWTCIDFWNEENAKRLVRCLLPLYPEMYVDNDAGDIVPADDYLKASYVYPYNNKHKI